jgi:hypothetical protein
MSWDPAGGLPDIKVEFSIDGNVLSSTPTMMDSLTAAFPGPFGVPLMAGSTLIVGAKDDDGAGESSLIAATLTPLSAELLRTRTVRVENGAFMISFSINPQ